MTTLRYNNRYVSKIITGHLVRWMVRVTKPLPLKYFIPCAIHIIIHYKSRIMASGITCCLYMYVLSLIIYLIYWLYMPIQFVYLVFCIFVFFVYCAFAVPEQGVQQSLRISPKNLTKAEI